MIKAIVLSISLFSFGIVNVVHAQDNKPSVSKKDKKDNKKKDNSKKDDDVTYLDMSTPDTGSDDGMPSITPKGKL
jgi:hypothetical protein